MHLPLNHFLQWLDECHEMRLNVQLRHLRVCVGPLGADMQSCSCKRAAMMAASQDSLIHLSCHQNVEL